MNSRIPTQIGNHHCRQMPAQSTEYKKGRFALQSSLFTRESVPKMPKRKSELTSYYRSKRFKPSRGRVEKIARPNQFINQLGGWSSNPSRRSKDVIRPFTTTRFVMTLTPQSTRGTLSLNMSTVPQAIRNVYQRVRVKKISVFTVLQATTDFSPPATLQWSVAKLTQIDPDVDPRNVPGAQVKLLKISRAGNDGTADVIRCSRMYPPINLDTTGTVGGAPSTEDNYLSTANPSGSWTCFCYDMAGLGGTASVQLVYYFSVELLCNTMKA